VVTDWQALKATDVVIVLDRSGSMDDNCPGGNADPGESPCALNDAKSAALTFADAVLDVRMDGAVPAAQQHRLGLVSFSSGSTAELPLTAANGIVTDNGVDDTGFETALGSINAGGSTSIAGGIREAINMLTSVADPNPHQAILVLTDGKENVAPCLGGNSASSCISADVLTAAEINNIQIVAVGFGPGAEEANLRDIAERHGGVFFAEADVSATLDLQKFFITAMGEIYDAAISLDPKGIIQSGEVASKPFNMEVGSEERLSVIMGSKAVDQERQCDLQLELLTPSGKKVDRSDKGVEAGHGKKHDFMHVALPYQGEAKGTWQGRIVRTGKNRKCKSQDYFYSVLMKGMGRVKPYVLRPNVVVGRKILASFRISEPNRPKGGFDNVTAKVTLTRPDGSTSTHTLYDDGTHGDVMKGNHLWSAELPDPATTPGPHHLRARFKITKDGHTMTREAEYSVVVQPEPKQCFNAVASGPYNEFTWHRPQAGDVLEMSELACLWNLCARDDRYKFEISDSKGWLKTHNSGSDQLVDLPSSFTSEKVRGFAEYCLGKGVSHSNDGHTGGGIPIIATIPKDSKPGDYTDISIKVSSVNGNEQQDIDVKTKLRVSPPPDCNLNKQHDAKDLAEGSSKDQNNNKVPDECEGLEHSNYHQEADHSLIESHWIKWLLALLILLILLALYWRKKK
ncbi:MAG: VWA domain-containing protein, partial [Gammaproteobacteria bacterium]|nr:VWA domain-containing protein [Gammaproteobacteria bacterium]